MFRLEVERVSSFGELVADSSECKGVAIWCRMGELSH